MPIELIELAWRQTWQVTLLAAAIAALVALCGRRRPHLAHALWLAMLLKCLTPPVWSSALGLFCWLQPAESPPAAGSPVPAVRITEITPQPGDIVDGELSPSVANDFDFAAEEGGPESRISDRSVAGVAPMSAPRVGSWLATLALVAWGLGSLIRFTATLVRFTRCWKSITAAVRPASPELLEELERLCRSLRIRRRVRLLVSATRIGPAVMGLFRPVIVLPEVIVAGRPKHELEPILAHELIHIRRGDLWVGCLRTLTCGLWWFHPLVRAVGRALAHEAERCVDEELISALQCEPARYARTLLAILELKRTLRPVPVFPGMKPVEITSQRLERIMSLRHGCRRRSPWWCWSALALVLAIALPGRALTAVGERGQSTDRPRSPRVERIERYYDVPELIEKLARRYNLSSAHAAEMLIDRLAAPQVAIEIEDRTALKILAPTAAHAEITTKLAAWHAAPYDQLITEAVVLRVPLSSLDTLLGKDSSAGAVKVAARTKTLDEKAAQTFWSRVREDRAIRIVAEPRTSALDRQPVVFDVGQERQFVTGYEETAEGTAKPQVTKICDGLRLELRPAMQADGAIEVSAVLEVSDIGRVEDATVLVAGKQESVEYPDISIVSARSTTRVVPAQTLILRMPQPDPDGESRSAIVVAVRVHPVVDEEATIALPRAANDGHLDAVVRTYAVADLGAPEPRWLSVALPGATTAATPAADPTVVPGSEAAIHRDGPTIDLAPLQTLIETVVAPESWSGKGGSGQMQIRAATSSLVIRQTPTVHQQIATLLSSLRHELDLQVTLELNLVRFSDRDWLKRINWPEKLERPLDGIALSPARVAEFRMLDDVPQRDVTTRSPKLTLFNEQVAEFSLPSNGDNLAKPLAVAIGVIVDDDRRGLRLNLACNVSNREEALTGARSFRLASDESLLIDLGPDAAVAQNIRAAAVLNKVPYLSRAFQNVSSHTQGGVPAPSLMLLVTPRIIVVEEEEAIESTSNDHGR